MAEKTAYCPTCRTNFKTDNNPPYAVIHKSPTEHLHALTRTPLEQMP